MDGHEITTRDIIDRLERLPCAISGANGVQGTLKAAPEHFQVTETLPYPPCGRGPHIYVTLRRALWNTVDVARKLGDALDVSMRNIGWGGMKDRRALTTQTFSVCMKPGTVEEDVQKCLRDHTPFEILNIDRHTNKIKLGHVRANRFEILLAGSPSGHDLQTATATAKALRRNGLPNFYGEQRFGDGYRNVSHAAGLFEKNRLKRTPQGKFWISVLQAAWFNIWLAERMERGDFHRMMAGDIAKKTDTGGMFTVDTAEAGIEPDRFDRRELTYCGPIFGRKMKPASGEAGKIEDDLLRRLGLDAERLKGLKSPGSRRAALLWLEEIRIESSPEGLWFFFTLPSGSYATTLMREFTQKPPETPERTD